MLHKLLSDPLYRFRAIALLEGISFLFLLFIAMPLKYQADLPAFVQYGGWAHGVLFISYLMLLFVLRENYRWSIQWTGWALLAGLVPFGTFVLDHKFLRPLQRGEK